MGSLSAVFWLMVGLHESGWSLRSTRLTGLVVVSAVGILIAWRHEGAGGIIVALGAVTQSLFIYLATGRPATLALGIPFLVTGLLFIVVWWRSKRKMSKQ